LPSCCPTLTVIVAFTLREQLTVTVTTTVPVCSSTTAWAS